MKKFVLITDTVHEVMNTMFEEQGYTVDYLPDITLEETYKIISKYHGAIINSKIKANKKWLSAGVNLEFLGRLGSGMEIIDVEFAQSRGIAVFSAPEGNRNAVAEHALGMLLMLSNKLLKGHYEVKERNWDREGTRGFELQGKTIGIIGFGNNGRKFAEKLQGMEMKILAYDKYLKNYTEDLDFVADSTPAEIRENCDIISLHLPLTDETFHYVNNDFINECNKPFVLINTARGKNIDTKALLDGLNSGKIIGACLDVFENEKPQTFSKQESRMYDDLYTRENVVLSPHVAGWTVESKYKIAKTLLTKIFNNLPS